MLLFYASYMSFIGVLELHTIHRAAPNLLIAGTIITYIHMDEGAFVCFWLLIFCWLFLFCFCLVRGEKKKKKVASARDFGW